MQPTSPNKVASYFSQADLHRVIPARSQPPQDGSMSTRFRSSTRKRKSSINGRIRVVVMGSAKVGKTSIVRRLVHSNFIPDYKETVEDMYQVNIKQMELEIVDTAGAFCFPAMLDLHIRTADVFLLVFAWNDTDSFEYIKYLMDKITALRDSVEHVVIAGNKMDLQTKTVSFVQTEMVVCLDWDRSFQECSAKNNENISRLFEDMIDAVRRKRMQKQ